MSNMSPGNCTYRARKHKLVCAPLQLERSSFYFEVIDDVGEFLLMDDMDKIVMLIQPDYVKKFGHFLDAILRKQQSILNKPTG